MLEKMIWLGWWCRFIDIGNVQVLISRWHPSDALRIHIDDNGLVAYPTPSLSLSNAQGTTNGFRWLCWLGEKSTIGCDFHHGWQVKSWRLVWNSSWSLSKWTIAHTLWIIFGAMFLFISYFYYVIVDAFIQ